jgi:uncharacterized protein (DUF302 family)
MAEGGGCAAPAAALDTTEPGCQIDGRPPKEEDMDTQAVETNEPSYGWTKRLPGKSLDEARALAIDALKQQGFGILTEIDVRATLQRKLGAEFRPYVILGACNPELAHRALSLELPIGLLLPCNVCVWQEDDAAVVAFQRPDAMFQVVRRPGLDPIAGEATERLRAALDRLS